MDLTCLSGYYQPSIADVGRAVPENGDVSLWVRSWSFEHLGFEFGWYLVLRIRDLAGFRGEKLNRSVWVR